MTTLDSVLDMMENPDRMIIVRGEETIYMGFKGILEDGYGSARNNMKELGLTGKEEVLKIRLSTEIRHKEWRERGLMAPLKPEETPDYKFSDLQMNIWYKVILRQKNS